MQRRRFDAELSEGVPQGLLGNCELSELIGQSLGQLGHVLVALPVVFQQLEARLQVQIHGAGSAAQLLGQNLFGALQTESRTDAGSSSWLTSALPPLTLYVEMLHLRALSSVSLAGFLLFPGTTTGPSFCGVTGRSGAEQDLTQQSSIRGLKKFINLCFNL